MTPPSDRDPMIEFARAVFRMCFSLLSVLLICGGLLTYGAFRPAQPTAGFHVSLTDGRQAV
jgi:hypothetical protein